jgi:hypothetical protein
MHSQRIAFIIDNFPDGTYVKEPSSNLYKILDSMALELDIFVGQLDTIRNSRFLEDSYGMDLDKLGKLLSVYRFYQETDIEFRNRIRVRVPSFIGGGTIASIENIIREYLKVEATVIEHFKPGFGFSTFTNGVIFGIDLISNNTLNFNISGGIAYINGQRITKESEAYTLNFQVNQYNYYIFLDSNGDYVTKLSPITNNNEILLYHIFFDNFNNVDFTITNLIFKLNPSIHKITNTSTITIQLPFDVDESILTIEEVKNIIMSTKAAGIAVLIKVIENMKENIDILEHVNPYFLAGSSYHNIGSNNRIGHDRSLKSLEKIDETLAPYQDYTFKEVGASSIGFQEYGGF